MGPTAGMFDSIFFNCLRVIGAGIAIGLCSHCLLYTSEIKRRALMHLLVIEDERALCETIVRSLRRLAYSVDYCYDGEKALELSLIHIFRACPTNAVCFRYGFGDGKEKENAATLRENNNKA